MALRTTFSQACRIAALALALPAAADAPGSLRVQYAAMEASLLGRGALRVDRGPAKGFDPTLIMRDFVEAAFLSEYGGGLTSGAGRRHAKPLLRWEEPVRIRVLFGAAVPEAQRATDRARIRDTAARLHRASGHPVTMAPDAANLHVLVVTEKERRGLTAQLSALVPGVHRSTVETVARMRPSHLCMVIAEPHADRRRGYARAIAIVRAEHTERMRAACIEEELAQAMGLSNDCVEATPSIFNDDMGYAVLTRRDEILLEMLYDRRLQSGMTLEEARPIVTALAHHLAGR